MQEKSGYKRCHWNVGSKDISNYQGDRWDYHSQHKQDDQGAGNAKGIILVMWEILVWIEGRKQKSLWVIEERSNQIIEARSSRRLHGEIGWWCERRRVRIEKDQ